MADKGLVEEVVEVILNNWDAVRSPDAQRDAWDNALRQLFPDYPIWNLTDFNYNKRHSYQIVFHHGHLDRPGSKVKGLAQLTALGGSRSSMYVSISVIAPFYEVKLLRRQLTTDDDFTISEEDNATFLPDLSRLAAFLQSRGYSELPREVLHAVIPDVELDLAPRGKVTVYNCLFYDQDE